MRHKGKELRGIFFAMLAVFTMMLCMNITDKAYAATSGEFATSEGFQWSYDEST